MNTRLGLIGKASKDELISIISESDSVTMVLSKFGLRNCGGNANTLKKRCISLGIDLTTMYKPIRKNKVKTSKSFEEYCALTKSRRSIKKYIIENKVLEYKCTSCGNDGFHNERPLVLQLDHVDGNPANNNIDNLRFLCPNCHSQTETFAGKKNVIEICKCSECGTLIRKSSKTGLCRNCNIATGNYVKIRNGVYRNKFEVSKVELEELLMNNSLSAIGVKYGVSDNAVRKRCIRYGIDLKSNKFSKQKCDQSFNLARQNAIIPTGVMNDC